MNEKPIKVLQFIVPVGFYGAERWVLALVNNSNPHQVIHDLAVTEESGNQDLEILNQFPKLHGQTHKVKLRSRFDLSVIKKLVDIIRERQIDIIHTHGYKSDILGLLAAKKTGIKCVSTPHGFGQPSDLKLRVFIRLGVFLLRFFDRVVPLSKQLEDEVMEFGVPPKLVTYIKNGVDLTEVERYRQTKQGKNITDKKIIGFIGQMIPRKNIKDLLDIFDQVHKQLPNTELQLLGDGENREQMEAHTLSLSSVEAIHFLGFRHDRMDYLKQFDLFVMTSHDEGIPRCLMEAMGMEIPVAAYNIKGIDQLVKHEETGLLATFGDKTCLTEYWLRLLKDNDFSNHLAKQGRDFVNDKFSGKRMASEYANLFKNIISP